MPESLQTRFYTLIDPSVGPSNAQTSAEGRAEGLRNGVILFQRFPLSGCGPGYWRLATGGELESHILYGQVMGEMGFLGIVTFGTIVGLLFWNVHQVKSFYRRHPEIERDFLYRLVDAIGMAVILLLVIGAAGHNLYRYSWLWYGGFLTLARNCVEQKERLVGVGDQLRLRQWPVE